MIQTTHSYGGVTATVYVMGKGETIPRHQHPFVHTTSVAAGRTEIEVYRWPNSSEAFQMRPDQPRVELSPNIDHEIRALVDGTVVVNLSIGENQAAWNHPDYAAPAKALRDATVVVNMAVSATVQNQEKYSNPIPKSGGVALHDGTVVDAD